MRAVPLDMAPERRAERCSPRFRPGGRFWTQKYIDFFSSALAEKAKSSFFFSSCVYSANIENKRLSGVKTKEK